jgi:hypothetical protein
MRIGHKYYLVATSAGGRRSMARSAAEHVEENHYDRYRFDTPQEFLRSSLYPRWVREVHHCYVELLGGSREVLSVGAGMGEHDVLLHLAGFSVISTDLVAGVNAQAARLFPGLRCAQLDVLDPSALATYASDAALITGLDSGLGDGEMDVLFRNLAAMLARSPHPEPRLVLTLRYRDNLLTRLIDTVVLPCEAHLRRLGKPGNRVLKKVHGYRRSAGDLVRLSRPHGLVLRRTRFAGFAVELDRSAVLRRIPARAAVDRRLHVASNCVVLEFVPRHVAFSGPRSHA